MNIIRPIRCPRCALLLAGLLTTCATIFKSTEATPAPFPWSDSRGVNIHYEVGIQGETAMLSRGFTGIRMDLKWDLVEQVKGVYNFSLYDILLSDLEKNDLETRYLILDYSNKLYCKNGEAPQTPQERDAFARFAVAAAKQFSNRGVVLELWNEPNGVFWPNASGITNKNATQYAQLLNVVGEALKIEAPGTVLTGPTTAGVGLPYIQTVLEAGGLRYLSGVSVHPYRASPPEDACYDYALLRQMIANYSESEPVRGIEAAFPSGSAPRLAPPTPAGTPPVLSSEWGYTTCSSPASCNPPQAISISELEQAAYLQRRFVADALCGVPMSIDYDWRNGGDDPSQREQNFGGVLHDPTGNASEPFTPKPKFLAAQAYRSRVGHLELQGRVAAAVSTAPHSDAPAVPEPANGTFVAEFTSPTAYSGSESPASGEVAYAAWTLGSQGYCSGLPSHHDCGVYGITKEECVEGRGCCYVPNQDGQPWCQWPMGGGRVVATFEAAATVPSGTCFEQVSWNGTVEGRVCGGGQDGRQLSLELSARPTFLSLSGQ